MNYIWLIILRKRKPNTELPVKAVIQLRPQAGDIRDFSVSSFKKTYSITITINCRVRVIRRIIPAFITSK
jgi:hypothetical protein